MGFMSGCGFQILVGGIIGFSWRQQGDGARAGT